MRQLLSLAAAITWIFVAMVSLPVLADNQKEIVLKWRPYSSAVFEEAKRQHKRVLLYGKVSWCHWCQNMNRSTFTDPLLIQAINQSFIPVKIDLEEDLEPAQRYRITEIPAVLIFEADGRELKRYYGYSSASSLRTKLRPYSA